MVALVAGWFILQPQVTTYVNDFVEEVTALEEELVNIEASIAAGTMTPQAAAEAQRRIISRLDGIESTATQARTTQLSDSQRAQLNTGLNRLRDILVAYQATLEVVDEQVAELPEAERPVLGRGRTRVVSAAVETVATVEGQVALDEVAIPAPETSDADDTEGETANGADEHEEESDDEDGDDEENDDEDDDATEEEEGVEVGAELELEVQ